MRCLNLLLLGIVTFASTGCCVSMSGGRHSSCLSSLSSSSSKKHSGTCQCGASRNGKSSLFGRSHQGHGYKPTPLFAGDTWPVSHGNYGQFPSAHGQFMSDGCGEVWSGCGECTECGMAPATCSAPSGMVSPGCDAPSCVQPVYTPQPDCHAPADVFSPGCDCGSGPVSSMLPPASPDCTAPGGVMHSGHPPVMSHPYPQPYSHPHPQPQVQMQPQPVPPAHFSAPGEAPQPQPQAQPREFFAPESTAPPAAAPTNPPAPVPAPEPAPVDVPAPTTPVDPVSWEVPAFPPLK
jgi:hypothetical protein